MSASAPEPAIWSTARVDGVLADLTAAGVVGPFERQLAHAAWRAEPTATDGALLALALVARATRLGHVCLELGQVASQVRAVQDDGPSTGALDLPPPDEWQAELEGSALVATGSVAATAPLRPLVWDGGRLYLQRYWAFECMVADELERRSLPSDGSGADTAPGADEVDALDAVFADGTGADTSGPDLQRLGAERARVHSVTVLAGGPGTGKTHTIAGILAVEHRVAAARGTVLRAALAAPTGKAASRLQEAVGRRVVALEADGRIDGDLAADILANEPSTIHRLLGAQGRSGFRYGRNHPLPHDLVVVDETSMVSLPLLAHLVEALRPSARLVLVGDPFQLSSIEAGTVMADVVGPLDDPSREGPLAGRVTELVRGHRFGSDTATGELARAIRQGRIDDVLSLLGSGDPMVHWVRPDDTAAREGLHDLTVAAARDVVAASLEGAAGAALAAATRVKVLAAVRRGPNGLFAWSDELVVGVRDLLPPGLQGGWPRLGTPVMVTSNDPVNRLSNGDVGVVVDDGGRWVAMEEADGFRMLAPARLGDWEPWWAMTIHKSQGSEFGHAVVALPTVDSPILTRELLYTAVTRGKPEVTVVATEEIIRLAVGRPVARASGLRDRLWPGD